MSRCKTIVTTATVAQSRCEFLPLQHLLGRDLWINLTKQMRMLAAIEPTASKRATR
jgi:hypothetical protein